MATTQSSDGTTTSTTTPDTERETAQSLTPTNLTMFSPGPSTELPQVIYLIGPTIMRPFFVSLFASLALTWLLGARLSETSPFSVVGTWLGLLLIACGAPLWLSAIVLLVRAVNAGRLETRGPYALCANPIYVFCAVTVAGVCLALRAPLVLVAPAVLLYGVRRDAWREAVVLEKTFGDKYRAYRANLLCSWL
ncbi:hypothetical protein Pelo_9974 [Pelomyxa schiedti]|nr:hypothetical protein Pelo_9974 [Pelomyxa schiedti]